MSHFEFMALFPDNDSCLAYLKDKFYADGTECPKCGKPSKFHRITGRSAYSCQFCGHHVYPTAGTIMHKSTTSLHLWFWAIYLMSSTRCGISAKQLEREIGVTYKTAHRMFKQIRTLLNEDNDSQLGGEVEMDETWIGGKVRNSRHLTKAQAIQKGMREKTMVFGAVERGGRVRAKVIPNRSTATLSAAAREFVLPASMIYTDEWPAYGAVGARYRAHRRVAHKAQVYVDGDASTNTIEGFWSLVKNGIRGTYHSVSAAYLPAYLDEFSWRYNHRHDDRPMFWTILDQVGQRSSAEAPA